MIPPNFLLHGMHGFFHRKDGYVQVTPSLIRYLDFTNFHAPGLEIVKIIPQNFLSNLAAIILLFILDALTG